MIPHYIFEDGIRPWQDSELPNSPFATISLVVSVLSELPVILNKLLPALGGRFVHWFLWLTLRQVFEGNAMQKQKLAAALCSDAGQFRKPVVRLGDRIISSVASIEMPVTALELQTLSDHRRKLMIGSADSAVTSENLAILMAPHAEGCDARAIAGMLGARDELIFGQCFDDSDTHAAFQWFGHNSDLRLLELALIRLGIRSLKSRTDVTKIMHC